MTTSLASPEQEPEVWQVRAQLCASCHARLAIAGGAPRWQDPGAFRRGFPIHWRPFLGSILSLRPRCCCVLVGMVSVYLKILCDLVPPLGLEPRTAGLKVRCANHCARRARFKKAARNLQMRLLGQPHDK